MKARRRERPDPRAGGLRRAPRRGRGVILGAVLTARLSRATRVALAGGIAVAALSALAYGTGRPWIFPSLGPTAFLLFAAPTAPANAPRRALLGHALALAAGYAALALCGLLAAPAVTLVGVDGPRIAAAALALALTGGAMIALDAEHPPAGATTLIVALGLLTAPRDLALALVAVALLLLLAAGLGRALRLR